MTAKWMQYSVECSDGEMSESVYDSLWLAEQELARIQNVIQDFAMPITAWIVEREVEAGEWERT